MVPSTNRIRNPLLMELYHANPDHYATPNEMYDVLQEYFEGELEAEDFKPYRNSKSKWANTIQVTRTRLVNDGLVYSAMENKPNEWKLTDKGIIQGRSLYVSTYEEDPWKRESEDNIPIETIRKLEEKDEEEVFKEGKELYRLHRSKERNSKIIALKKSIALEADPNLPCEVCGLSFKKLYGGIGEGFIEAHHLNPISELTAETKTKINDLALLCSNCHKMIHRKRPWLSIDELKKLLINIR